MLLEARASRLDPSPGSIPRNTLKFSSGEDPTWGRQREGDNVNMTPLTRRSSWFVSEITLSSARFRSSQYMQWEAELLRPRSPRQLSFARIIEHLSHEPLFFSKLRYALWIHYKQIVDADMLQICSIFNRKWLDIELYMTCGWHSAFPSP